MERTPWEKAIDARMIKEKQEQEKNLENNFSMKINNQRKNNFANECDYVIRAVLFLAESTKVQLVFVHVEEKPATAFGENTKVTISALDEHKTIVHFDCKYDEACSVIKYALKNNGIPYIEEDTYPGLVIKIT